MAFKTSTVPQMDFLLPSLIPKCHRPTKLTGDMNKAVLAVLATAGPSGATAEEIDKVLGWPYPTAGPKLPELRAVGLARKTEARRNGKSVWVVITDGCQAP